MANELKCTVVAFYGTAGLFNEDLRRLCGTFLGWFSSIGRQPDKMALTGTGYSGKQVGFARANAVAARRDFEGVAGFSLTVMSPGGSVPTVDYDATADYSGRFSYALIAAKGGLIELDRRTLDTCTELARLTHPRYGIGYTRQVRLGPVFYAIGLSQGLGFSDPERAEAVRISRWGDRGMAGRVFDKGLLRDVYCWNFLNEAQRNSQIQGRRLEDWIGSEAWTGELSDFTEDLALWKVTEHHNNRVRSALLEAGLLFPAR